MSKEISKEQLRQVSSADCRGRASEPTCLITGADGFQVPLISL